MWRPTIRVGFFRFAAAPVLIPEGRSKGIQALLQSAIEAFSCFFPQIANVVGCHDCLNVGRESSSARVQVEAFIGKMHFDADIDQICNIRPVLQISRTPVNLLENDPLRFALAKQPDHLAEDRPSQLRRRFPFFEPTHNGEVVPLGIP